LIEFDAASNGILGYGGELVADGRVAQARFFAQKPQ